MTDDLLDLDECGLNVIPPLVVIAGALVYAGLLGYFTGRLAVDLYTDHVTRARPGRCRTP